MASNFKIQNMPSLLNVQVSKFSLKPSFSSFNFISRSSNLPLFRASIPFSRLHCLSLSSSPVSGSENSSIEHPFEVSYLMNTFGWPPELAISKAKFLKFKSPEKPEKVLEFFKKYGFTDTQISLIIKKKPVLLTYNPEEAILPKFEFLRSMGLSTTEIIVAVTQSPYFLTRSLEKTVKPAFKHLRSLVNSDDEAVEMVKRGPTRLMYGTESSNAKTLKFKTSEKPERVLAFLKNYGFTEIQISHIVKRVPTLLVGNPEETYLPKLEFLSSVGLSTTEITEVVTRAPHIILRRSVEDTLKPAFERLRSLVNSDDEAVKMVIRFPTNLIANTGDEDSSNGHPFEVSYLINSFGWSPEVAIANAKYLKFKTPEKPERVLAFLKNYGFTETQISLIIKKHPRLLVYNPKKTLLPKFEFLRSLGLSTTEIIVAVTQSPYFLGRSLENTVKPAFKLLRSLVDSDDEAIKMVMQSPRRLARNTGDGHSSKKHPFEVSYLMNTFGWSPEVAISKAKYLKFKTPSKPERVLAFLKKHGFTETQISLIIEKHTRLLLSDPEKIYLPKFEFLWSLGLSRTEVTGIVTKEPSILARSLEHTVKPAFKHLRSLVDSDDEAIKLVVENPISLTNNIEDEDSSDEHPFEVSYLINTFGWPPKLAISKAKRLKFKSPEKPERMLAFLKKHGFTETQISLLVKGSPQLLLCDPEISILPKFEFLSSVGLSTTEITDVVTRAVNILRRSLENIIEPAFKLLRSLVISDDEAVKIVKRYPAILSHHPEVENIQILVEAGVPAANIVVFMGFYRRGCIPTPDTFRRMVEEVQEMGLDPCRMNFLKALQLIRSLSESDWEDKKQFFKKYGWSNREILLAFEKYPYFIMSSSDRIERTVDFLVNTMGIEEETAVAYIPNIIERNLEKKIVPRCLVYKSLLEKGLCERKLRIGTFLAWEEAKFFAKFIEPYENEAPELWDLYKNPFSQPENFQLNRDSSIEV